MLAEEKAELAQEKKELERERKANDRDKKNNAATKALLERKMADLAVQSYSIDPEVRLFLALTVGALACIIPGVFVLGTMAVIQLAVCRRVSDWVLGLFGI